MIQTALVTALFLAACFYVGRIGYRSFFAKKTPCEGCAVAKMYQPTPQAKSHVE